MLDKYKHSYDEGKIVLDSYNQLLIINNKSARITKRELQLFVCFLENFDSIITRIELQKLIFDTLHKHPNNLNVLLRRGRKILKELGGKYAIKKGYNNSWRLTYK